METRIQLGEAGELTVPRQLMEGQPVEEGTLMRVHLDSEGNVILKPVAPA